jgi:predicted ATPase/DNA-binding CsgD family transcriptional regulator
MAAGEVAPPTSFVGRASEITEVARLMEGTRLLTLTGPGGVGKTRLALAVAERAAPRVADGATFVDLTPVREPVLVPPAVAHALGLRETEDPAAAVRRHLGDRCALLLLDNLEQVIGAATFVGELLRACPRLVVLATSRAPLRIAGEQEYAVPPLGLPPSDRPATGAELVGSAAVQLFLARARAVRPSLPEDEDTLRLVAEICRRLDGLPLAIELAAARLRAFAAAELLDRLGARPALLGGGARDAPARQRTLRAAIDWSHDLLDPPARALFRRLAVFEGGWTLDAAEEVCADVNLDGTVVVEALVGLVEQSLVVADARGQHGRYRFLETIRAYAAEQLAASGEEPAVRDRNLAWIARLAASFEAGWVGPRASEWLARIEPEVDNLRAALAWARDAPGRAEAGLALVAELNWFWNMRGRPSEGVQYVETFLAAAPARTAARVRALGSGEHLLRARAWAEEALAIARELGAPELLSERLKGLGLNLANAGDYAAAIARIEEALALVRPVGGAALMNTLRDLGSVSAIAGDRARGRAVLEESVAVARAIGSGAGEAQALLRLAQLDRVDGDYAASRARLERSLPLMERWHFASGRFWAQAALANLARAEGRLSEARKLLLAQLLWATTEGDCAAVQHQLCSFGVLAATEGNDALAVRLIAPTTSPEGLVGTVHTPDLRLEGQAALARAREALDEAAYDAALTGGRTALLDDLVAEAAALAERPPGRATPAPARSRPPDALTARERQVVALAAAGHTNRQIAEALVVSDRTVETHVANALGKLGFRSRAQLAAWAVARRLVEPSG